MSDHIHSTSAGGQKMPLAKIGGGIGIAASCIGLAIFLAACAGASAVFYLSFIPLLLGLIGLIITVAGGLLKKNHGMEDTQVLAAIFICVFGIIGGLLEVAVWQGWPIIFGASHALPMR
jgi:hypothetical protein